MRHLGWPLMRVIHLKVCSLLMNLTCIDWEAFKPPLEMVWYWLKSTSAISPTVPKVEQYSTGRTGRPRCDVPAVPDVRRGGRR